METALLKSRGPHYPNTVVVLVGPDKVWREKAADIVKNLGYEVQFADVVYDAIRIVQNELELHPVILITEHNIDSELRAYDGITLIKHLGTRKIFPIASYFVHDCYDDVIFGRAKEAGAEVCFSKTVPLGDYFCKTILRAKELLRLQHAESLDRRTSSPENGIYVYNETGARARFEHTWREARSTGRYPACVAIDLKGFGGANKETHTDGHRLIKEVASEIDSLKRPQDYLVRDGGDEFYLWLTDLPDTRENVAAGTASRMNKKLGSMVFNLRSGKPFKVVFRYGIATAGKGDEDLSAENVYDRMTTEANMHERLKKSQESNKD